ncbi:hypothetical protein VitviT2T_019828 [Vitis vinifera]|uniref:Fumarylacetoacetase-like C-terminal domain-containing protein n=2 Tax=Vitis vinifera TaxID=29760 RepID=A0ABY9D270_VITVI
MILKIPFLISHINSIMTLLKGDVILTGTPPGVGPVKVGQKVTANITSLLDIHFNVEKHRRLESCQVAQICPVVVIAIDSSCHTCPSTQEKG